MKRKPCVYKNVAVSMMMLNMNIATLAQKTYTDYKSMCKKLNGDARITIEEAISIYNALDRLMPIEKMSAYLYGRVWEPGERACGRSKAC